MLQTVQEKRRTDFVVGLKLWLFDVRIGLNEFDRWRNALADVEDEVSAESDGIEWVLYDEKGIMRSKS